ncbi:MAG: U32 family peptidase [Solobacterium sp.]|nr:U32 family peptidase [Solobacterium sp.]
MRRPELLAPAGDLERCRTAILYGADTVYLGGKQFSLRSRASNFTMDDIREACSFASEHGAHIHVTVNMIPHNEDFEGLADYLVQLQDAGVSTVIAASPAVMAMVREYAPAMEVHCSTQMSITNAAAADYLAKTLGINRVVLARECTMEDVRRITASCSVDTEAFIHGGMCVNYSGRCTLSNRMTLRDANRGGCAQSCRWRYRVFEGDRETGEGPWFTMGSRDLCAAREIADLMEAGVASFKIEGRMKTEYYVASIVSGYRHLIDDILENGGALSEEKLLAHEAEIMKGENREVCPGFYSGIPGSESLIEHPDGEASLNHRFLGKVETFRNGHPVLLTRNPFSVGDRVEVMSPGKRNRFFTIEEMRDEEGRYLERSRTPMRLIEIPVPFEVNAGDMMRRDL